MGGPDNIYIYSIYIYIYAKGFCQLGIPPQRAQLLLPSPGRSALIQNNLQIKWKTKRFQPTNRIKRFRIKDSENGSTWPLGILHPPDLIVGRKNGKEQVPDIRTVCSMIDL